MIDLRCNDCIEEMKKIPSKSIDCIITSPPYWKGFEYEAYFNSYKQYLDWCELWLKECKRILKPNGTFWLNVINDSEITIRAFELMEIATKKIMFKLHDTIIWYRYNQQPANTNRQLTNQCEYVFMLRHTSSNIELHNDFLDSFISNAIFKKDLASDIELDNKSLVAVSADPILPQAFNFGAIPNDISLPSISPNDDPSRRT